MKGRKRYWVGTFWGTETVKTLGGSWNMDWS